MQLLPPIAGGRAGFPEREHIMNVLILATGLSLALLVVAGCGNTTTDRALSGGGIGAGVGLVGGALVGAPVEGALIGGAAGAAAGGLTDKKNIDLGDPIWE